MEQRFHRGRNGKGRILLRSKLSGSEHGKAETLSNQRNYL